MSLPARGGDRSYFITTVAVQVQLLTKAAADPIEMCLVAFSKYIARLYARAWLLYPPPPPSSPLTLRPVSAEFSPVVYATRSILPPQVFIRMLGIGYAYRDCLYV